MPVAVRLAGHIPKIHGPATEAANVSQGICTYVYNSYSKIIEQTMDEIIHAICSIFQKFNFVRGSCTINSSMLLGNTASANTILDYV